MITAIDATLYEKLMRVLPESHHPEARNAVRDLRIAHLQAMARDIEFNNELPALLRAQA